MATAIRLPGADGTFYTHTLGPASVFPTVAAPVRRRVALAAAHVVAHPLADNTPGQPAQLDWDATLAFRHHLWDLGLGVAEAMDTAQRGMGLDWAATRELIRRSVAEARARSAIVFCGAGTDQLAPGIPHPLSAVTAAYLEQCAFVEDCGGRIILMASRALAAAARGPEDYARVYGTVLRQVRTPVILHWLGPAFDPQLAGYWGGDTTEEAMDGCLAIIRAHAAQIDGIKISLLDAGAEVALRRQLPADVRLYTGDDFNYPDLIIGDEAGHSDALLGIFAAIAPAAVAALQALDEGDPVAARAIFAPTVPLARHCFAAPTYYYKTGITFLAYLNGYQDHFRMVQGLESARSVPHLVDLLILADRAGLLRDPEQAAWRMRTVLALAGVAEVA